MNIGELGVGKAMPNTSHGQEWSEEETVLAFYLYCQIPFSKIRAGNPEIIRLAEFLQRTPNAVALKLSNLAHFDPELQKRGVSGMKHASKKDSEIFAKYENKWEDLVAAAEEIIKKHKKEPETQDSEQNLNIPEGLSVEQTVYGRQNQQFFRAAVLSSYQCRCCITGISVPELLIASHIKPWAVSDAKTERTNPHNGLCLNCLHDKAFDRGLMTVLPDFTIRISSRILEDRSPGAKWLASCNNSKIEKPERFLPSREFLQYHNDVIFIP